jgi:hypothetical protein
VARRRPASRLDVRLVSRDPAGPAGAAAAIARLGPVVGGLLRERSRARDSVTAVGPGRFSMVLPETPLDGGEVVATRLVATCEAWLAAETPPLRLDLSVSDHPAGLPSVDPTPDRPGGPERRRTLVPEG